MLGKRVKLASAHEMHPMVIHLLVGECGTVEQRDSREPSIWLVLFDNGKRIWSRSKYLEVIE
jgi:hypothetical protein